MGRTLRRTPFLSPQRPRLPRHSRILLVFSKTSLQINPISPSNPRALYFSANAYVGWVPGGMIEAIVFDKNLTFHPFLIVIPIYPTPAR